MTFAAQLLAGRRVATAGAVNATVQQRLRALAAEVVVPPAEVLADEDGAGAWARERAPLAGVVIAAGGAFAGGGADGLTAALELSWRAARALATGAMIDGAAPGKLVFLAPGPDAGRHAQAARAGLENLARTLSVEWARHAVTAVAITPGAATTEAEIAELVCYLLSPAGGYFTGCRFDLGTVPVVTPAR